MNNCSVLIGNFLLSGTPLCPHPVVQLQAKCSGNSRRMRGNLLWNRRRNWPGWFGNRSKEHSVLWTLTAAALSLVFLSVRLTLSSQLTHGKWRRSTTFLWKAHSIVCSKMRWHGRLLCTDKQWEHVHTEKWHSEAGYKTVHSKVL